MDSMGKLHQTVSALYGPGLASRVPKGIAFEYSRKTGRIKTASLMGRLLCTMRPDGGLALTPYMAGLLAKSARFRRDCCVEIDDESAPFVMQGKSVFCSHVVRCGRAIRAGSEVPVLHGGQVIAVGRAVVPCEYMQALGRGPAVKIRDTLKEPKAA